jgi:hypothetical protein
MGWHPGRRPKAAKERTRGKQYVMLPQGYGDLIAMMGMDMARQGVAPR